MKGKKRAEATDFIEYSVVMVGSVILMLIFPLFLSAAKANTQDRIDADIFELDNSNEFLIYYANYPLPEGIKITDLVSKSAAQNDYAELEPITRQILSEFFQEGHAKIVLKDHSGNIIKELGKSGANRYDQKYADMAIPFYRSDGSQDFVKMELVLDV